MRTRHLQFRYLHEFCPLRCHSSMKEVRPPPGAVKTGPIAAACAFAAIYYVYNITYHTAPHNADRQSTKVPFWKPSNRAKPE